MDSARLRRPVLPADRWVLGVGDRPRDVGVRQAGEDLNPRDLRRGGRARGRGPAAPRAAGQREGEGGDSSGAAQQHRTIVGSRRGHP